MESSRSLSKNEQFAYIHRERKWFICVKHLVQCLAHKNSVNINV